MSMCRKTMAVILAMIVLISSVARGESVEARTKKVSLSKKKLTLAVGKSVKLKLKNNKKNVKWSVSAKKVVKLNNKNKKGVVVKALKKGTAKVTAKIGKKKYVCRVVVEQKQTPEFKETSTQSDSVSTPNTWNTSNSNAWNTLNPGASSSEQPGGTEQTPEPGKTPEVNDDETSTFMASGIVRDASGNALSGIEVYFGTTDEEEDRITIEEQTVTSEDGRYSIELEKGKENAVRIGGALMLKPVGSSLVKENQASYDIILDKSLIRVTGKVTDASKNTLNNLHLYLSEESADNSVIYNNLGGFWTDSDGKYSQWLEKDTVYSVTSEDTGKTYNLNNLNTADVATYDLKLEDTLCLVEGILKKANGTISTCKEIYVGNRTVQLNDGGRYSFWITQGAILGVSVRLPDCPITCDIGSVTGGEPVTYELVIELEMCNIAGRLVYADKSDVEEFKIGACKEGQDWPVFTELGENGKFGFSLPKGKEYMLKTYIGQKSYSLGMLVAGDEDTYSWELPVSLQKICGSLQDLKKIPILEQKISFYEDTEKKVCNCAVTTDTEGKYEVFLEKGKTYYPVAEVSRAIYDMQPFVVSKNENLDMQIEKELSDICETEIEIKTDYFTVEFSNPSNRMFQRWRFYKDGNGAVGELAWDSYALADKHVYLPTGEKMHLRISDGAQFTMGQVHPQYDFFAGTIIVGDLSTYQKTVSLCKLEGDVCDKAGMPLVSSFTTSASNMTIEGISGYGTMGNICLTLKNISDNTTLASIGDNHIGYGLPGEEYEVMVKVNQNTYDLGTIVADEKNYKWKLDIEFAPIQGKVSHEEAESEEKTLTQNIMDVAEAPSLPSSDSLNGYLRFYEKETDRDSSYQAQCAVLGDSYSLYLEKGKSYYVRRGVQSGSYGNYEWIDCGTIVAGDESTYEIGVK